MTTTQTTPDDLKTFKPSPWLADKLAIAVFPGGNHAGYWCRFVSVTHSEPPADFSETWITIEEFDPESGAAVKTHALTLADLARGLELMIASPRPGARRRGGWVLDENGDGSTQDLLLQYACFGKAKYG